MQNTGLMERGYYRYERASDGEIAWSNRYVTTETVDDTVRRLGELSEPWFAYVAFNAPHAPLHVPPIHLLPSSEVDPDSRAETYRAMVQAMDAEIGRLGDGYRDRPIDCDVLITTRHSAASRVPLPTSDRGGILVADEAEEAAVRAALQKGDDFEATARTRSKDESTRDKGEKIEARLVEGRYHETFVNVADVFTAVGATPPGQVAGKAVVTASGRWVVRVDERVDDRQKPFEDVAEDAGLRLRAEREQAAVKKMVDEAVTSTDVKIFEERLK